MSHLSTLTQVTKLNSRDWLTIAPTSQERQERQSEIKLSKYFLYLRKICEVSVCKDDRDVSIFPTVGK